MNLDDDLADTEEDVLWAKTLSAGLGRKTPLRKAVRETGTLTRNED